MDKNSSPFQIRILNEQDTEPFRVLRLLALKELVLTVVAGNKSAVTLYENLSFYRYGTDHGSLNVQGQMLDEDLMALRLETARSTY
jgi:RimJ/RimL family protein N-acetyltransferase